jgi:1-acyl-sn-glycerol-3-phosphate acyltransferase
MGIFISLFIFKPGLIVSLFLLFWAGTGAAILTITLDTVFQRVIPDGMKGKIFATRGVFTNTVFLLCLLLAGAAIQKFPVTILFLVVGISALLAAARIFVYERAWGYLLLRGILRLLMRVLFDFRVSGMENIPRKARLIFAGNHTSVIDGISLMCAYPGRIYFLAADSLFKTRFWGWCARRLGYIPIKRGGFNKEAIKNAVAILRSGFSVGIFPEGKISADGRLDEGKAGVALLAKLAETDIIPFAIEGAYEAWPLPRKFPRRFPIEVRFGKPIDVSGYAVQEEIVQEVMKEIAQVKLYLEREGYVKVDPDEIIRHLINMG